MADFIKGVNVRNALKTIGTGVVNTFVPGGNFIPKTDYDILDDWSVAGGARNPVNGGVFGPQYAVNGQQQESQVQTPNGAWHNPNTSPYGDGGAGASIAYQKKQIAEAQAEYEKQRKNLEGQFGTLIGDKRREVEDDFNTNSTKLKKNYEEQRGTLKKGYDTSKDQGMARLAAKGISQSEETDNWLSELLGTFNTNMDKINTGESDQIKAMERQLTDARKAIDNAEWNFWNDLPKFGTVEEAMTYKSSLDKQKQSIQDALDKVNSASLSLRGSSATDYAGKGMFDMLEDVNKLVSNAEGVGIDPFQSGMVKNWISKFYTDPNKAEQVYQGIVQSNQDRSLF